MMATFSTRCLGIALAMAFQVSASGVVAAQEPLSKGEILAQVRQASGNIQDLRVAFDVTLNRGSGPSMIPLHTTEFAIKGSRFLSMETLAGGERAVERWLAWDGEASTQFVHPEGKSPTAAVYPAYPRDLVLTNGDKAYHRSPMMHRMFFTFNLSCPAEPGQDGRGDESLESLLAGERAVVRPALENLDGHLCHVIDLVESEGAPPRMTVWLDHARGFVPLRQEYRTAEGALLIEYQATEVAQASQGHWFVIDGIKRSHPVVSIEDLPDVHEWRMQVVLDGESRVLRVNAGIEDSVFSLWQSLPPGTRVGDERTGTTYRVASGEPGKLVEEFLATRGVPAGSRETLTQGN